MVWVCVCVCLCVMGVGGGEGGLIGDQVGGEVMPRPSNPDPVLDKICSFLYPTV